MTKYVVIHQFGANVENARPLKEAIFKDIQKLSKGVLESKLVFSDGDAHYGIDRAKLAANDAGEHTKMQHINANVALVLFVVLHDAETNELVFEDKMYQLAVDSWKQPSKETKSRSLLHAAEKGHVVTFGEKLDPAYAALGRMKLSTGKMPPMALVVVETPTQDMSQEALDAIYPSLLDEAEPKDVALTGEVELNGNVFPMRRLIPYTGESGEIQFPLPPGNANAEEYLKKIEQVNKYSLQAVVETMRGWLRAQAAFAQQAVSRAVGCGYCKGTGCAYCGGKKKKQQPTDMQRLLLKSPA